MKKYIFYIPIADDNLGGSIWIRHIGDTLKLLGHDVRYCHFESDTSYGDYTIIQSEWIEKNAYKTSKRAIVLLGHFTAEVYPDSTKLRERDIVLTQWKGEVVEDWEKRSGLKAHYFPHGYFQGMKYEVPDFISEIDAVWIGSSTQFRDVSRFNDLPIFKTSCREEYVNSYYRTSKICPNVHLNIQKGQLINVPESILTKPGYAVNERLFWICGAGGFQLADENPLIREFYGADEVEIVDADGFKERFNFYLNHPEKRQAMAKKAQERTLREHTYEHRITKILLPLL
jgi:hypothetical protein